MIHAPSGPLARSHWQPDCAPPIITTTVGSVLRAAAASVPERTALVFGDRRWSYRDLLAQATDGARALLGSFIPGDVVAVWAENCAQWVALEFAAGLAGITLVPLNPAARADEVAYVLAHSGARGIFVGTDDPASPRTSILRSLSHRVPALRFVISLPEWEALCAIGSLEQPETVADRPGNPDPGGLPEVCQDTPAQILYTAGTTGHPKGVLLTHGALTSNSRLAAGVLGLRYGDTVVSPLPLSHVTGCGVVTLGTVQMAGTHVLLPRFDPARQLAAAERHRADLLCADPAMLCALLAEPFLGHRDLGSVRAVISGGAPVPPDLAIAAEAALGAPVLTGLFQTEAGGVVTVTSPDDTLADRLSGVGRPVPGTEMKITGLSTGETLPCGTVGEIRVRGQVMRGYLDEPRLTAEAFDDDGWLRTGDLGAMDSRGYCRVVGRAGELIVRGGQTIYPREIEAVLSDYPAVAEAAVVGVPDRLWGETVAAIVRLAEPGPEASRTVAGEPFRLMAASPALALTEYCGGRLPPFKIPVRWLFVDSFPRTTHGNVRKIALSARLADATEPDWQSWMAQTPADLAAVFESRQQDPFDLSGAFADELGLRVPPQTPRSKALEDIDY